MRAVLQPSSRKDKKFEISFGDGTKVNFGAAGMSDYTLHKDAERKARYIARHMRNEDWSANGYQTAGFWSRWLLWNQPSLAASIADVRKRFGIQISK